MSAFLFTSKHFTVPLGWGSENVTNLVAFGGLCSDPGPACVAPVPYLSSSANRVLGFLEPCPSNMVTVTCILCL